MRERDKAINGLPVIRRAEVDVIRRPSLVDSFLSGRSPRTLEAYRSDLVEFARFMGVETLDSAAEALFNSGPGGANETAHRYRAELLERGLSPATVNRRLAALRSLCKLGRLFGLVSFTLEVEGVKSQSYRDTRGPGRDNVRRLLEGLASGNSDKNKRDLALIRLLYDLALRRGEVVSLDLEHVDLKDGAVSIIGKGRTERETLTLPVETREALAVWLSVRGSVPGPLFFNLDRARKGGRLTGRSVARIVSSLGAELGLTVRPHGLRHSAITTALDLTGGNTRAVQRYSRHKDLNVLSKYDDNRVDLGGEVARRVAGGL